MKIGVVSDTHNNLKNIETIITLFNSQDISLVVHTGDIANAVALNKFSELKASLIGVYGNNDRTEIGLDEISYKNGFNFQKPPKVLSIEDREIAIFHEPEPIDNFLLENRNIDIVLHGHTHRYRNEDINGVKFFNPGECAGSQKGKNAIGIVEIDSLEINRIFF